MPTIEPSARVDAARLVHLVAQARLHPEHGLHPSWLPPTWPLRHRRIALLGPAGRDALADWLRSQVPDEELRVDTPLRRLLLVDARSLRRLSCYLGLALHAPLLRAWSPVGAQLRRQARRIDRDAQQVVLERLPALQALRVDPARLERRPIASGRVVMDRGHRLLQAMAATEGGAALQRVQRKLPRRASAQRLPSLDERQRAQLQELMLMGIVPERLAQWDWLF